MNIAIFGASGGIGSQFLERYKEEPNNRIFAFSRQAIDSERTGESQQVSYVHLDFENESTIAEALNQVPKDISFDLVLVCTGILHSEQWMPEKSYSRISMDQMLSTFQVNTFGPALIAKYFLPKLNRQSRSVFAFFSARVGSISDNRLGGWYSYRASKSALNMMIKCLSIETERKNKHAIIVGLHPGTVETNLSAPFQSGVAEGKLFSKEQSVSYLSEVINGLTPSDTGKVFAWDGAEIPS